MGAGPFQRGSIYDGTAFAGNTLEKQPPAGQAMARRLPETKLARESVFTPPQQLTKAPDPTPPATAATPAPAPATTPPQPAEPVQQASYQEPQAVADPAAAEPKTAAAASDPVTKPTAPAPKLVTPSEAATAAVSPEVEAKVAPAYTPGGTSPLPQPRFSSR
jgi:5'-nucleotidase